MTRQRSTLVPLAKKQDAPPIFLVAPLGGTVSCYLELAQAIAMPCIGLVACGVDGQEEPLSCIEAMAASNIEAIGDQVPQGPFHLAGWSFGGLVAYEMAVQLSRAKASVHLTLLDCRSLLAPCRSAPFDDVTALAEQCDELARTVEMSAPNVADLRRMDPVSRIDHVVSWACRAGVLSGDIEALVSLMAVYRGSQRALQRYTPGHYPGQVQLLRAMHQTDADPTLGWGELCKPEVVNTPGDHYTMLESPHVATVAEQMTKSHQRTNSTDT